MGNWQLEAVKMVGYIAFPVTLFHWFNQPENFTSYVEEVRRTRIPEQPKDTKEIIEAFIEEFNREKDLQEINAMQSKISN